MQQKSQMWFHLNLGNLPHHSKRTQAKDMPVDCSFLFFLLKYFYLHSHMTSYLSAVYQGKMNVPLHKQLLLPVLWRVSMHTLGINDTFAKEDRATMSTDWVFREKPKGFLISKNSLPYSQCARGPHLWCSESCCWRNIKGQSKHLLLHSETERSWGLWRPRVKYKSG